jgi:hypothetical protein
MSKLLRDVQDYDVIKHVDTRDTFKWGTYGKQLKDPLRYVYLKDMSDSHIINVITNCNLPEETKEVFSRELYFRLQNREYSIKGDTRVFVDDYENKNKHIFQNIRQEFSFYIL